MEIQGVLYQSVTSSISTKFSSFLPSSQTQEARLLTAPQNKYKCWVGPDGLGMSQQ